MAKVNGIQTNLTGSAGAWTFCKRLGVTVAKEKVVQCRCKNISEALLEHYARWGNLVAFWSRTNGCLKNGFRHKRGGQTDYNIFTSMNLTDSRVFLTREMIRKGACVAAPYQLTDGSLPTLHVEESADGRVHTDICLGEGFVITPDTSLRDIGLAIVDNNHGFKHGDSLFCIVMEQTTTDNGRVPQVRVLTDTLPIDLSKNIAVSSLVEMSWLFASVDGHLGCGRPLTGGVAWIHTRPCRDRVAVSTQRMFVRGETYERFATDEALAAAKDSYRKGKIGN